MPQKKRDRNGDSELKRKFREALESKQSNDSDPNGNGLNGPGHAHDVHGQADHKRVFRRKSI